jgi:hypothetical protein
MAIALKNAVDKTTNKIMYAVLIINQSALKNKIYRIVTVYLNLRNLFDSAQAA